MHVESEHFPVFGQDFAAGREDPPVVTGNRFEALAGAVEFGRVTVGQSALDVHHPRGDRQDGRQNDPEEHNDPQCRLAVECAARRSMRRGVVETIRVVGTVPHDHSVSILHLFETEGAAAESLVMPWPMKRAASDATPTTAPV